MDKLLHKYALINETEVNQVDQTSSAFVKLKQQKIIRLKQKAGKIIMGIEFRAVKERLDFNQVLYELLKHVYNKLIYLNISRNSRIILEKTDQKIREKINKAILKKHFKDKHLYQRQSSLFGKKSSRKKAGINPLYEHFFNAMIFQSWKRYAEIHPQEERPVSQRKLSIRVESKQKIPFKKKVPPLVRQESRDSS